MRQFKQVVSTIRRNKATSILVILQVALTLTIVTNTLFEAMFSLSAWNQPTGLAEKRLISVRHQVFDPNVNVEGVIDADIQALKAVDWIEGAELVSEIPLDSLSNNVHQVFKTSEEDAKRELVEWFEASQRFLGMIDAEVLEGRNFTAADIIRGQADSVTEPVTQVMISKAFAEHLFPDQSAIGQTLWLSKGGDPVQIIGVYSNFLAGEVLDNYHTMVRPRQIWQTDTTVSYLVKVNQDATGAMLDEITDILYQQSGRYVEVVEPLTRPKKRMFDGRGSHVLTLMGISLLAMLITVMGITGLITFSINQRRKQIGIRRALGGTKRQIVNFFVLEVSLLSTVGLLLGFVLMLIFNYVQADTTGGDGNIRWIPLIANMVVIWLACYIASIIPSKRAAQIPPATVTRGL